MESGLIKSPPEILKTQYLTITPSVEDEPTMASGNKRALLIAYGGGHITMLMPVRQSLMDKGWKVTVIGLTTAARPLNAKGIPFLGYKDFLESGDSEAVAFGRELADQMHTEGVGISREESVAYLGLSFWDLVKRSGGETEARKIFEEKERHAFFPVSIGHRAIEKLQPDVVIATNSPRSEKAFLQAAQEQSLPTISIVDSFGTLELCQIVADRICVLSEITRDNLVAHGSPASAIRITGNPVYDECISFRVPMDAQWKQQTLGLSLDQTAYLWIDQPAYPVPDTLARHYKTDDEVTRDLDIMRAATAKLGGKFLVRPHPSQAPELFDQWAAKQPDDDIQIVSDLPLYPLLNASDAVIGRTSTVLLEAVLVGTPALVVDPVPGWSPFPLPAYGMALRAENMNEVEAALRRLQEEPETREAMKNAYKKLPSDGNSVARIIEVIEEVVSQPSGI